MREELKAYFAAAMVGGLALLMFSYWISKQDDGPVYSTGAFTIGAATGLIVQAGVRILGVS